MHLKEYFFPSLNVASKTQILTPLAKEERIPKIIHQTFHNSTLPPALMENVEKIKLMNPDWEYRFYDDADIADFIRKNYDLGILRQFSKINPIYGAARADLFRYLLMYKCGGIYLDIKSSLKKPLNEVIKADDCYLLSGWRDREKYQFEGWGKHVDANNVIYDEFQQWHIVATPGHPFLRATIENVLRNIDKYIPSLHGVGKPGVLNLTGPIAYTLSITPLLKMHPHRFVYSRSEMGFEYSVFNEYNDHKTLFKTHYSNLDESIIKLSNTKKIFSIAIKILKKLHLV